MFDPDSADPFRMASSYFQEEPFIESEIIVYDGEDHGSGDEFDIYKSQEAQLPLSYILVASKAD
jgi:hypothetical protein